MGDDMFTDAMGDPQKLMKDILGSDYDYGIPIKNPSEMGMSSRGTIKALTNDVKGILGYMDVMVAGGGRASKVQGPLGDKLFMKTAAKCKDIATKKSKPRSVYINNVPDGTIPFMPGGTGDAPFSEYRGLLPGIMANVGGINPMIILQAFMSGPEPECRRVTLETVKQIIQPGNNPINERDWKSAYVTDTDIQQMNPCWFPDYKNPVTGSVCQQGFTNMAPVNYNHMPKGWLVQLYFSSLGLLGLYIFLKLLLRPKNI